MNRASTLTKRTTSWPGSQGTAGCSSRGGPSRLSHLRTARTCTRVTRSLPQTQHTGENPALEQEPPFSARAVSGSGTSIFKLMSTEEMPTDSDTGGKAARLRDKAWKRASRPGRMTTS